MHHKLSALINSPWKCFLSMNVPFCSIKYRNCSLGQVAFAVHRPPAAFILQCIDCPCWLRVLIAVYLMFANRQLESRMKVIHFSFGLVSRSRRVSRPLLSLFHTSLNCVPASRDCSTVVLSPTFPLSVIIPKQANCIAQEIVMVPVSGIRIHAPLACLRSRSNLARDQVVHRWSSRMSNN